MVFVVKVRRHRPTIHGGGIFEAAVDKVGMRTLAGQERPTQHQRASAKYGAAGARERPHDRFMTFLTAILVVMVLAHRVFNAEGYACAQPPHDRDTEIRHTSQKSP